MARYILVWEVNEDEGQAEGARCVAFTKPDGLVSEACGSASSPACQRYQFNQTKKKHYRMTHGFRF
ncbi:hypothetical protein EMIT0P74_20029 [Pseudomonas sp. IT-P74]